MTGSTEPRQLSGRQRAIILAKRASAYRRASRFLIEDGNDELAKLMETEANRAETERREIMTHIVAGVRS